MHSRLSAVALAIVVFVASSPSARALRPVSADEAPKAQARLLRALNEGAEEVRVLVGLRDGTSAPRTLAARPDPAGEPGRRVIRLAAQKRLADELPEAEFRVRHFYESFSVLAGRATRDAVVKLANHPDVQWVSLDGTRRRFQATPQNAQVLMRSDQANAVGFTGAGQTVAVLDTGVDYTVAELGGGPFPNAKVIGGMDTADEDNDPMDCDDHGTSVSGVVAGPRGVAPGAKIVALKVFGSTDATNGSCNPSLLDQGEGYAYYEPGPVVEPSEFSGVEERIE